ncbi:hypothetical protein C2845_PM15G17180 [Panicum miliaceum]|uniref:Uncharacterized protein n=1 Tax=Panicum miliaceum TaxID=4540 RepID=A0A3L6QBG3_PANMI|nr:hypothetical protein C2845_PM15G17180 [Panicum miliaceum]
MRAAPFSAEGNGAGTIEALLWPGGKGGGGGGGGGEDLLLAEPTSVLDCRRSPSPPYSTSTLSSSLGGAAGDSSSGVAAVSENSAAAAEATKWAAPGEHGGGGGRKEEWAGGELPPIPGTLDVGFGGEEGWDAMLGDAAAAVGQEQTFLNWIMAAPGEMEPPPPPLQHHHQLLGNAAGFGFPASDPLGFSLQHHPGGGGGASAGALASDLSSPGARSLTSSSGSSSKATSTFGLLPTEAPLQTPATTTMPFHDGADIKPPLLGVPSASANLLLNQHQPSPAASFFMPLPSFPDHQHQPHLPPPPKRHHSMPDNLFLLQNQLQPPQQQGLPFPPLHTTAPFQLQPSLQPPRGAMKTTAAAQQQQQLLDELAAAAKAAEVGNSIGAREILARLNQQLPPIGKPFLRSASYFKEALLLALTDGHHGSTRLTSPLDVALKLAAYKSFSDLSPVLQFANFTATQALLDEIACTTASCIRVIDFDLGVGGQWASFLQELAHRRGTGNVSLPMLKLTAFVSTASHHPLELHLTRDNLSQFAADLGIPFELNAINLDAFDPAELIAPTADELVAVCLPVGCSARTPPLPMLLQLVKQLSPKVVVAIDHGSDRGDLSFSQHFMNCLQSCMFLLDSLDAAGTDADAASKIERFLIQPRVEDAVLGRRRAEKPMAWRAVFTSAGFAPIPLSNLAEAQADCLLKRVQVRGFHVEKCGMGLALYWQRGVNGSRLT